jgi:hypothetical protein
MPRNWYTEGQRETGAECGVSRGDTDALHLYLPVSTTSGSRQSVLRKLLCCCFLQSLVCDFVSMAGVLVALGVRLEEEGAILCTRLALDR